MGNNVKSNDGKAYVCRKNGNDSRFSEVITEEVMTNVINDLNDLKKIVLKLDFINNHFKELGYKTHDIEKLLKQINMPNKKKNDLINKKRKVAKL